MPHFGLMTLKVGKRTRTISAETFLSLSYSERSTFMCSFMYNHELYDFTFMCSNNSMWTGVTSTSFVHCVSIERHFNKLQIVYYAICMNLFSCMKQL